MVKQDPQTHAMNLRARAGVTCMILMTDSARLPEPEAIISKLPSGSIVIFRDYDRPDRGQYARQLREHAKACGHLFLVAGDVAFARSIGADGIHLPEYMVFQRRLNLFGFSYVTAACHSRRALCAAVKMGVDMALVSPVFATKSHPDAAPLGVHRLSRLMQGVDIPIAALGGINGRTAGQLKALGLSAVAGISGMK